MHAIWKKFVLKEASLEAAISKLYLASRLCFLTPLIFHPTQIGGKEKNLQLTLHPSQGQQTIFSPSNYPLSSMLSFQSLKYACLAQNNLWLKSSHNPKWCLKGLSEAIWTKSLGQNDVMKTQPGCWVLLKMAAMMFKFWASLETIFIRKTCTSQIETSLSSYICKFTQYIAKRSYYQRWQKIHVFWSDLASPLT